LHFLLPSVFQREGRKKTLAVIKSIAAEFLVLRLVLKPVILGDAEKYA
jgi:hypothetical protein